MNNKILQIDYLKNKKASAILIAMLITALLLIAGLSLNSLIIKEMRIGRTIFNGLKSYYAAEAAVEDALYRINNHIPGYEAEDLADDHGKVQSNKTGSKLDYNYEIYARDTEVPCAFQNVSDDIKKEGGKKWQVLNVQESFRIPLYSYDKDKGLENFDIFKVSFYMPGRGENAILVKVGEIPGINDALRWQVSGMHPTEYITQSMGEYIPLLTNSVTNPTQFGTDVDSYDPRYSRGKYKNELNNFKYDGYFAIADFINPNNGNSGHTLNYLVLTNVVEQEFNPYNKGADNRIYFRIEGGTASDPKATCNVVKASAKGIFSDSQQDIDIFVDLNNFLPAFDFALYRTVETEIEGGVPLNDRRFQPKLPRFE